MKLLKCKIKISSCSNILANIDLIWCNCNIYLWFINRWLKYYWSFYLIEKVARFRWLRSVLDSLCWFGEIEKIIVITLLLLYFYFWFLFSLSVIDFMILTHLIIRMILFVFSSCMSHLLGRKKYYYNLFILLKKNIMLFIWLV